MIRLEVIAESWKLKEPFQISRETIDSMPVIVASLTDGLGRIGWAEAAGVSYDGESVESMQAQLRAVAGKLHDGIEHAELEALLPPGGARNALDCALWDLRATQAGIPVWQLAGLPGLRPVATAITIGLGTEDQLRRRAAAVRHFPLVKLKADATRHVQLVRIVREVHPRARIVVDANQAWSIEQLKELMPEFCRLGVELIEQPLPRGCDEQLRGLEAPISIAADESCTDTRSIAGLRGLYSHVNIKLDKCGGLTEALAMVAAAKRNGLGLMVGNMCGTSLAMAPAFLIAQDCEYVDLDGALLQTADREWPMACTNGTLDVPAPQLWG